MIVLLFEELMKNHLSVHFKKIFNNYVCVHTVHTYCSLSIPTNAQTCILKYFISTPTHFSASAPSYGRLNFVLAKVRYY
jgi:hypothetical protein